MENTLYTTSTTVEGGYTLLLMYSCYLTFLFFSAQASSVNIVPYYFAGNKSLSLIKILGINLTVG